jgi:hypothetical protein
VLNRCPSAALAAWLLILLCAPVAAKDKHPQGAHFGAQATAATQSDLYSARALRRARRIVEMKLLELRERHLGCAREVIERRLPSQLLWDESARRHYPGALPRCLTDTR